jgi:hypothetical protein
MLTTVLCRACRVSAGAGLVCFGCYLRLTSALSTTRQMLEYCTNNADSSQEMGRQYLHKQRLVVLVKFLPACVTAVLNPKVDKYQAVRQGIGHMPISLMC